MPLAFSREYGQDKVCQKLRQRHHRGGSQLQSTAGRKRRVTTVPGGACCSSSENKVMLPQLAEVGVARSHLVSLAVSFCGRGATMAEAHVSSRGHGDRHGQETCLRNKERHARFEWAVRVSSDNVIPHYPEAPICISVSVSFSLVCETGVFPTRPPPPP